MCYVWRIVRLTRRKHNAVNSSVLSVGWHLDLQSVCFDHGCVRSSDQWLKKFDELVRQRNIHRRCNEIQEYGRDPWGRYTQFFTLGQVDGVVSDGIRRLSVLLKTVADLSLSLSCDVAFLLSPVLYTIQNFVWEMLFFVFSSLFSLTERTLLGDTDDPFSFSVMMCLLLKGSLSFLQKKEEQ